VASIVTVHSVALGTVPILFVGLLGLSRRLRLTDLTTAALVAHGFGCAAVMRAVVADGFIATAVIERIVTAEGPARGSLAGSRLRD